MPRGRPATPSTIKELAGNPGKRRVNKSEPKPTGMPVAPPSLSARGLVVWQRTVAAMPAATYSAADEPILASYCEAVGLHQLASEALRTEPAVVPGSTGNLTISPWIKIQSDQARLIASIGARLGLDPVARQSMTIEPPAKKDSKFSIQ